MVKLVLRWFGERLHYSPTHRWPSQIMMTEMLPPGRAVDDLLAVQLVFFYLINFYLSLFLSAYLRFN